MFFSLLSFYLWVSGTTSKEGVKLLLPGRKGKRGKKTSRATIQKGSDVAKGLSSAEDDLTRLLG